MECLHGLLRVASWGWVAWSMVALGQSGGPLAASQEMPRTYEEALHSMSDAAAVIFAGQVMSVRRVAGVSGASGVVEVTFRVERAVRGCDSGGTYVLREWAGLWAGGDLRYRVGQRLMMLLRAQGAGGVASAVGGMDGAIPIRGSESEIGSGGPLFAAAASGRSGDGRTLAGSMSAAVAAEPALSIDLRWVAARVVRAEVSAVPGGVGSTVRSRALVNGAAEGSSGGVTPVTGKGEHVSVATAEAPVDTVMGMLTAWEVARAPR